MDQKSTYKYFAFISYSSQDTAWGKRLHRRLEQFRLPSAVRKSKGLDSRPMKPVFFAPADIQPGGLNAELEADLRDSQYLIVICSPSSAKSKWVGREIEYFHSLGRTDRIFFFIIDGTPHSGDPATECFNPVVNTLGLPEILGVNIHERTYRWSYLNRERAFIQLVTKLLGVSFDTLWQRERRRRISRLIGWSVGAVAVTAAVVAAAVMSRPVDVDVSAVEASAPNPSLPQMPTARLTLHLDEEVKRDSLTAPDYAITLRNIPRRYLGNPVRLTLEADGWQPLDTTVTLDRTLSLPMRRDETLYGDIRFRLWDPAREAYLSGVALTVDGIATRSDTDGNVSLTLPLAAQRTRYAVTIPSLGLTDTITMPCGPSDVLVVNR